MSSRRLLLGLVAVAVTATSCQSTARDAFLDAYNSDAEPMSISTGRTCESERASLAEASEQHLADHGLLPTDMIDLLPYLDDVPPGWRVNPEGATASDHWKPAPGSRCDLAARPDDSDDSIGQIGVDAIEDATTLSCTTDQRTVATAIDLFYVDNGFDPTTPGDLAPYLDDELTRWTIRIPVNETSTMPTAVPLAGGPCDG